MELEKQINHKENKIDTTKISNCNQSPYKTSSISSFHIIKHLFHNRSIYVIIDKTARNKPQSVTSRTNLYLFYRFSSINSIF